MSDSARAAVTEVLLVRHGRTAMNAQARLSGRHEVDLDEHGEQQAEVLGESLALSAVGRLVFVTSPLRRCVRTAELVADACGEPAERLNVDDRFIEMDYGEWDGRPLADVPLEVWRQWRRDPEFAPPGGESLRDVSERVRGGLTDWVQRSGASTLVVSSHVSPIKAAVITALGVDESATWRMRLSNASISRLSCSIRGDGGLDSTLVGFNEVSHLIDQ